MHHALATVGKVALGSFLVLLAFAAVADLGASLGKKSAVFSPIVAASSRQAAPAEEVASEETAAEEAVSEITSPEEPAVQDGASKDGASKDDASKLGASKDGTPQDGASQDGASQDGTPQDGASKDAASKDAASKDAVSQDAASKDAAPTPAEVLAARFPAAAAPQPPSFSVASLIPALPGETFDPTALSGMATAEPAWPDLEKTPAGAPPEGQEPAQPEEAQPEPAKGSDTGLFAPARRPSSARSPNVVNDAMIASIKRRLRLTAEQEKLWLPVEAALRKLTYTRAAMNAQPGRSGAIPYIDPASSELRELKAAALPLILRLNDGQKREVKDIIHVMGLEAVASQF